MNEMLDARVTFGLKVVVLILLVWLLMEKIGSSLSTVGYAANIALGGAFLAYLMLPLVRLLNRRMCLWAAVTIVYLGVAIAFALACWLLVPVMLADVHELIRQAPMLEAQVRHLLDTSRLPFVRNLPVAARDGLERLPAFVGQKLQSFVHSDMGDPLALLISACSVAALFIAIPVTSVYMLLEAAPIKRFLLALLPEPGRLRADVVLTKIDGVLGGYIRGQALVALTIGTLTSIMLLALHVPYALLVGAWAGVMDVIPYVGAAAGAIPGVFLALITGGVGDALAASLGFALIFELEGQLIAPKIVSRTVGVSPLTVIFAVIMGGELFGIAGMFVAVPIAGILRVLIETLRPPGLVEPPHLPEERPEARALARRGLPAGDTLS